MNTLLDAALAAHDAGLCVMRAATNGTKRPLGEWRGYQTTRPDRATVEQWFAAGHPGMGAICGRVSGGLEMVELEGRAVDAGLPDKIDEAMAAAGLDDLWSRVIAGYCERTPSGGLHLLWRCETVGGNQRLAVDEHGEVLIETRGEGGYSILAPSNGTTHPTGGAWELVAGSFATIATITADERELLLEVLRSFDHDPEPTGRSASEPRQTSTDEGDRPGDEFDAAHTCDEVLLDAGFTRHSEDAKGVHYTRPGKNPRHGSSATVWLDNATCTLFSSSIDAPAEYVDGHHQLTPWRLHVALSFAGDFPEAAREWRRSHPRPRTDDWSFVGDTTTSNGSSEPVPIPAAFDDSMVGEAFGTVIAGRFLHADQLGGWLQWDRRRWHRDHTEAVYETCRRYILDLGSHLFSIGADAKTLHACTRYRSKIAIDRVVTIARRLQPQKEPQ